MVFKEIWPAVGWTSTDLIIEQVLIRSLKTSGGLTRGRGMTEQQRTIWTLAMPKCAEINHTMQELSGGASGEPLANRHVTGKALAQLLNIWKKEISLSVKGHYAILQLVSMDTEQSMLILPKRLDLKFLIRWKEKLQRTFLSREVLRQWFKEQKIL